MTHPSRNNIQISALINDSYKEYCHYVIKSRALPLLSDGLKPVERRALYTAKKIAKDWCKVAKLAGAALSLHPHGNVSVEDCITGMTQKFAGTNNVPFFDGKGTFGSRITGSGKGIASARYVAVRLSESFFKYFDIDSDLISMQSSYDDTEKEPSSFLPLIPAVLLNPTSGIAVGFACNILPRNIDEIRKQQINHLTGKAMQHLTPYYEGFTGHIYKNDQDGWATRGNFTLKDKHLTVQDLPIGYNREEFVELLDKHEDEGIVKRYTDSCKDTFDFSITLSKEYTEAEVVKLFKLTANLNENITIIGFDSNVLERLTDIEVIQRFTDWRFGFYKERFIRLETVTTDELKFKAALCNIIDNGIFKKFPSLSRKEIIALLQGEGIENNHINKIMTIPIYKFGKDEVDKLKDSIKELTAKLKEYHELVINDSARKEVYIKELKN